MLVQTRYLQDLVAKTIIEQILTFQDVNSNDWNFFGKKFQFRRPRPLDLLLHHHVPRGTLQS